MGSPGIRVGAGAQPRWRLLRAVLFNPQDLLKERALDVCDGLKNQDVLLCPGTKLRGFSIKEVRQRHHPTHVEYQFGWNRCKMANSACGISFFF